VYPDAAPANRPVSVVRGSLTVTVGRFDGRSEYEFSADEYSQNVAAVLVLICIADLFPGSVSTAGRIEDAAALSAREGLFDSFRQLAGAIFLH
jgi:hypothetical protein